MQRALFDLKADAGRDAFLRLASDADVVIESFRPGVVDRLGIGYETVKAANPGVVYCSTTGYGQDGPYSQWAGHDINYLAIGGYPRLLGRDADGGPALPGATIGDGAGGGMHAVIAILAALVRRQTTGEGATLDVSVADGVVALMSLYVDEYFARRGSRSRSQHPHRSLRVLRRVPLRRRPLGRGRRDRAHFFANLCRALDCEQWIEQQTDEAAQDAMRGRLRRCVRCRTRDEWVAELGPADTAYRRSHRYRSSSQLPLPGARCLRSCNVFRVTASSNRSAGCAGMHRDHATSRSDGTVTDTARAAARGRVRRRRDRGCARRSGRVSDD
jgi:alpha-methylacyl-CoA racemase